MLEQFDINMEDYAIWLLQKALEDGVQSSDFGNSNEAYKAVEEVDHEIEKMRSGINKAKDHLKQHRFEEFPPPDPKRQAQLDQATERENERELE